MSRTLGPGSLTIGEPASSKEWGGDISKITLETSTSSDDPKPMLDGSELDGEDTYSYTLKGTAYQDYSALDTLVPWAETNKGAVLPFVFVTNAGGLEVSGNLKIRPITLGGDVKAKNTSDFEFQIIGAPLYTKNVA